MPEPILDIDAVSRTVYVRAGPDARSAKDHLADLAQYGEYFVKFALVIGFGAIFSYLTFAISFFPTGLGIADTFLFLEAGLVFGLVYVLLAYVGAVLARALQFHLLLEKGKKQRLGWVGFSFVCVLAVFVDWQTGGDAEFGKVIIGLLCTGFTWYVIFFGRDKVAIQNPGRQPIILASLFLGGLLVSLRLLHQANVNFAMPTLGLRTPDATLRLSEENYKILSSAVGGQEVGALGCDAVPGSSEKLVHGVTVLWHGIGERTLIGIPSGSGGDVLTVELERTGVFVMKNYRGVRERCVDLSGELLFKSGSAEIDSANDDELNRVIGIITQVQPAISEILVTGHSDPMAYGMNSAKNDALAMQRAVAVADRIAEQSCASEGKIKVESKGAREPKTLCKDWPVKKTLAECLVINRRVEIRMKFRQ